MVWADAPGRLSGRSFAPAQDDIVSAAYFEIWKAASLASVRAGVFTWTLPVLAPVGTVALISVFETTVNFAAFPLKVTALEPVRLVPTMDTADPILPEPGWVFTNGARPIFRLKNVPMLLVPPCVVVQ